MAKLTLSIPRELLQEAKVYSQKSHQPLSQLVSRYFSILGRSVKKKGKGGLITSRVKEVTGLAKSAKQDEELLFESLRQKYR